MKYARRRLLQYLGASLPLSAFGCQQRSRAGADKNVPRRIVSLSPGTTEILFAVGAGDRVVGRSRYCSFPPEVAAIPIVGGFVDANLEEIVRLSPDLVIGARGPHGPALTQKLESLGIATLFPPAQSAAEIEDAITQIAARVGMTDRGGTVVASMRARVRAVAAAVAQRPRVRALLVFGLSPIVVAGPASFPNEMLELANGENVVRSGGAYPAINAETLVTLSPDVVIDAAATGTGRDAGAIDRDAPGWRELAAIKEGRVLLLSDEAAIRPGPRFADGVATIARMLHPNVSIP
jgi:iron complex transport system substrate-binding protein